MSNQVRNAVVILGVAIVVAFSALGFLLGKAALSTKALERTVVVKGLSEREVAADVVTWPITFQVAANDLEQAYASIERNSAIIKSFLADFGLSESEMSVPPPAVTDLLAQQWGDKSNIAYRFTGTASVTVHTSNVDAVLQAMSNMIALGKKGVVVSESYSGGDRFDFSQLSDIKPEMIEEATKNARAVAEKFATDSNSRLGKIKSASQGQFTITDRDATTPHIKKVRVVSTIVYYLAD